MESSLIYLTVVANAIAERDKVIAKKIKKLKYRKNGINFDPLPDNQFHYNKAIDDVLALLEKDDEEPK